MSLGDPEQAARALGLTGPAAWFVTGEDNLRIVSFNSVASVVVSVVGRFLTVEGLITPFRFDHTPNTDRTQATTLHRLGDGWILNATAFASSGAPLRGQCFVTVQLVRGLGSALTPLGTLIQGYVTATQDRAWPGSRLAMSTEGPGVLRSVTGADPAAGAEVSVTVPTNARWRFWSLRVVLVCSADAANRQVALKVDDGTTAYCVSPGNTSQTASATRTHIWAAFGSGLQNFNQGWTYAMPPDLFLSGGHRLLTDTANIQAADEYGAPQLQVEEWIED